MEHVVLVVWMAGLSVLGFVCSLSYLVWSNRRARIGRHGESSHRYQSRTRPSESSYVPTYVDGGSYSSCDSGGSDSGCSSDGGGCDGGGGCD